MLYYYHHEMLVTQVIRALTASLLTRGGKMTLNTPMGAVINGFLGRVIKFPTKHFRRLGKLVPDIVIFVPRDAAHHEG